MSFLKKIQNLPESTKKIVLWSVVIIIGLTLFILWTKNVQEKLKHLPEFNLPSLKEELKELPKIELPEMSEGELKELERELKKQEQATTAEPYEEK